MKFKITSEGIIMQCVRCQTNEIISDEKLCDFCLKSLRMKFKIPKDQDMMENPEVRRLIQDYEKYY